MNESSFCLIFWASFVMIALSVARKYADLLSVGLSWSFSPPPIKTVLEYKRGPLTLGTWPSNLVFTITCEAHVPNLRKIGQNCGQCRGQKVCADTHTHTYIETDRQSDRHTLKWFYICPMPWIAWSMKGELFSDTVYILVTSHHHCFRVAKSCNILYS